MSSKLRFITVVSALIASYTVATTTYSQISPDKTTVATQIVAIGEYQPGEFYIPSGSTALALVAGASGSELIYTTVTIDTVYNQATFDTSALRVSVAADDSVQFILYSEDDLFERVSAGPVTSFDDARGFYYPGQQRAFWVMTEKNSEWWMLSATGTATDTREQNASYDTYPLKIHDYALKLHDHPGPAPCDHICRTLVKVEIILDASMAPVVRWVGDLDVDGKLDMIVDLSSVPEFGGPALFLSSDAKDGSLIRPVTWLAPVKPDGC
ncbi:MAG TPA: hypothetical protein VLB27_11775 [candidate division Zixibacteria bacterium]|nr:hypothetical protein [candidate division Zixibacteria bacterium]